MSETPEARQRFHGYVMVPIAVITVICTLPGQTIVVSQFNTPIREALGLSLGQISLAYLIGTSLAALPLTLVGRAADRFGLRVVLACVASSFAVALALLGQARGIVTLTIGFALVRFLGQGSLGMLSSHTLAMWFERRLGVMESIKHVGFSLGALVVPIGTALLIESVGWRTALPLLGIGVAVLILPLVATVFRNRPEDVGQRVDGDPAPPSTPGSDAPVADASFTLQQALRTRALWILLCSGPWIGLVGTAILFHTQPILNSFGVADAKTIAPFVQAPWAITLAITPFFSGWLADKLHPRWLLAPSLLLCGTSCVCVAIAAQGVFGWPPEVWVGISMAVFGVSGGVMVAVSGPTVARYFGRTHHGSIRGVTITVAVAATATGPFLFSAGADLADGRFDSVFAAFALLVVPLALASLTIRKPDQPSPAA